MKGDSVPGGSAGEGGPELLCYAAWSGLDNSWSLCPLEGQPRVAGGTCGP